MGTPRLASASSFSGTGQQNGGDVRPVILVPWLQEGVAGIFAYFFPSGLDSSLTINIAPAAGGEIRPESMSSSSRFAYDPETNSFLRRDKNYARWLVAKRLAAEETPELPLIKISLGTGKGALLIDLPPTHQIFTVFDTDPKPSGSNSKLFFNTPDAPHYRNVTKPLIVLMRNTGFLSLMAVDLEGPARVLTLAGFDHV